MLDDLEKAFQYEVLKMLKKEGGAMIDPLIFFLMEIGSCP